MLDVYHLFCGWGNYPINCSIVASSFFLIYENKELFNLQNSTEIACKDHDMFQCRVGLLKYFIVLNIKNYFIIIYTGCLCTVCVDYFTNYLWCI